MKVAYDKSSKNPIRSKTRIIRPHNASPRSRLGTRYFLIKRRPYGPVKNLESIIKSASVRYYIVAKTPRERIRVQVHSKTLIDFPHSVSVKSIQKRCGVSQSSISTFMSILENAELVESRKIDQYTYFRRNEEVIHEFGEWYNKEVSIQSDEIDKLLETVILEDTSYPATEERSIPSEQLAVEIRTKGPHHDEESK